MLERVFSKNKILKTCNHFIMCYIVLLRLLLRIAHDLSGNETLC